MNSRPSDALELYWQVKTKYNAEPLFEFCLEKGLVASRKSAECALDSVWQILACHAESPHPETAFVLAHGEVYGMYEALRKYHKNFDAFCYNLFKVAHHHVLLREVDNAPLDLSDGMIYTIGQLEGQYVDDLSFMLHEWVALRAQDDLQPCALIWSKRSFGEMFFPTSGALAHLNSRWAQFVE